MKIPFIPRRNSLFILFNNRVVQHDFLKVSENNIKTKNSSYALEPSHGLVDIINNRTLFFVNEDENNTFNPCSVKNDLNLYHRAYKNFGTLYINILKIIRNEDINKPKKTLEEIKETIYNFDEQDKIESDNIKVTPTTEQSIIENEVAKGLTHTNKISPWVVIAILGCGALIGSVFTSWIGVSNYDQRDYNYNENYYDKPSNETITISMISLNLEREDYVNFYDFLSFQNFISIGLISLGIKKIIF